MKKVYYSWAEIEGACIEIARQIHASAWRPDYIVGIVRGGLVPATLLSHYLDCKSYALDVSLRDGDFSPESNLWMAEDAFGSVPFDEQAVYNSRWDIARRKNILVVDDINDTGATINWIKKDWQSGCLPNQTAAWNSVWTNNVKFAVLTNNMASAESVDYYAWDVNKAEDNCWLVYPWEDFWKKSNRT